MTKRPTLDDVARHAGVSRTLVSTALHGTGRVSEATRERILRACEAVGYHPNLNARALATGSSHVIGVLLADVLNPFFATVADALTSEAAAHGLTALLTTGQRTEYGERQAIAQLLSLNPQGVVLIGPTLSQDFITSTLAQVPTVSISRCLAGLTAGSIGVDECSGVRLVVEHLVRLGHREIVHIDGGQGVCAEERRRAFLHWTDTLRVPHAFIHPGGFTAQAGYQATDRLLQRCWQPGCKQSGAFPTAIWAANDRAASGVLARLREAGLRVPDEVSVVGYDDVLSGCVEEFQLTTVFQPIAQMAQLAIARLLHPSTDLRGDSLRLTPQLVLRTSTAPPRKPARAIPN